MSCASNCTNPGEYEWHGQLYCYPHYLALRQYLDGGAA